MKTELKFKAQVIDPLYLTLTDFSQYNTDIAVENPIYRIEIPDFNKYVDIAYTPGTVLNVNSNLLNLSGATHLSGLVTLPAGLWTITQSVKPNDKVQYKDFYFNITPTLQTLKSMVCCYKDDPDKLTQLWDLKNELELAKILAEQCGDFKKAVSLFVKTCKEVSMINCSC